MKNKQDYQKRSIVVQKLAQLIELNNREPVSRTLSYIFSPIGEKVHPYNWTDSELLGKLEKEIYNLENGGISEDEY